MIGFLIGLLVGGVVMGIIAHRKPEWFAEVVRVANSVDDKINAKIGG